MMKEMINKILFKNLKLIGSASQLSNVSRVFSSTPRLFQSIPDTPAYQPAIPTGNTRRATRKVVEKGFYDTHSFINSLVEHKFTQDQAEQLCFLFKDIVNYIADDIKNECVTRSGQVIFKVNLLDLRPLFNCWIYRLGVGDSASHDSHWIS